MKYMGSKARFAKDLLPIILKNRTEGQYYVEPMAGGCNLIDKVDGNRIANDNNHYLIEMFQELLSGWIPESINRETYDDIRKNKNDYPTYLVGWAGFNCSYSGKFFGGFAGITQTKHGVRDYQKEALRNTLKQIENLRDVVFCCGDYRDIFLGQKSIMYFDPPYEGTTGYNSQFNHSEFWQHVRDRKEQGHQVFVSEYNAPEDFILLKEIKAKSSLSANGAIGANKTSVEKLFTL